MSALEAVAGTAVRPLETHANWTAADVADSCAWTYRLNVDEIAELEAALAVARSHTHEVLDVDKDRFPLPTLAPVLAQLADELINGRGFCRISALPYDFRGEQSKGSDPFYRVPVFTEHGDRLFVRYIRPYIEASQRHPAAPRLSDKQRAAMDAYDALIYDPDNRVEMTFAPGDMQFVNNYHVLHGRNAYQDDPATGRVRWLKRLWLATEILGPQDRPQRFQSAGATQHWSARRTRAGT